MTIAIVSVLLALNPPALARLVAPLPPRHPSVLRAVVAGGAVALGLALLADPLLDLLDTSSPTFRLGAAVVLGLGGAKHLLWPGPTMGELGTGVSAVAGLAAVAVATPPTVFTAVAASADAGLGAGVVAVGLTVAAAVAAVAVRLPVLALDVATRFVGAAAIATAIRIGLDAARTV